MINKLLPQLYAYLTGQSSIQDLENWLVSNIEKMSGSGDSKAKKIADDVDADLVFLKEGIINEREFMERVLLYSALASKDIIDVPKYQETSQVTSTSEFRELKSTFNDSPTSVFAGSYQAG